MKVIYAGTFNLFHAGHYHVYKQACKMFGVKNVYLCVATHPAKNIDLDFIKWTLNPITPNIITTEGLVADECPDVLIRGLRDAIDLSSEMTMADWNTKLGCQTVFIPCTGELRHLSSSALRQLHKSGLVDLVTNSIPEKCSLTYERWRKKRKPDNSIYCGKIGIGKSTYLKKKMAFSVDCDKAIWQFFSEDLQKYYKIHIKEAIMEGNIAKYIEHKTEMAKSINWSILFSREVDYEASALGQWLEYIPNHILSRFNVVELTVDERNRHKRLTSRGLNMKIVEAFDNFYKSPRFVDEVIDIT
jgi:cytidyltransferase-like protein